MAFPYYPHVPGTGVPCGPCGSPGNQFPYTVQHDANLNYICETVAKAMQEQLATNEAFTALDADFGKLVEYVNNYFNDVSVPAEVGKWMDNYVASGEMAKLVKSLIGEYTMTFPDDTTNAFGYSARGEMLYIAINWLLCDMNSNSIARRGANQPQIEVLFSYSQTKTYREYTSSTRGYTGEDTAQDRDGYPRSIVYLDCSAFVNLITRGIMPNKSLNALSIAYGDPKPDGITDEPGLSKILESKDFPWTFDFLGRANTSRMAMLMDSAGNPVTPIAKITGIEPPQVFPAARTLRTGDLLFKGSSTNSTDYKGIGHCGFFMLPSDLDNPGFSFPGLLLKSYNDHTSGVGYILECTGGPSTAEYTNVLRLSAFEDWLSADPGETVTVFYAKPATNFMLSNKRRSTYTMDILCKDRTYYVDKRGNVLGQKNNATLDEYFGNVRVKGLTIPSTGMDIDVVGYGTWQATLHDTINACTGHWPNGWTMTSAESIVIQQTGGAASGYGRLQILWANFGASDTRMAFRMRTPGSAWSEWAIVMTE